MSLIIHGPQFCEPTEKIMGRLVFHISNLQVRGDILLLS